MYWTTLAEYKEKQEEETKRLRGELKGSTKYQILAKYEESETVKGRDSTAAGLTKICAA